jgi:transcriptional regulator with XRE-family HTH domain
MKQVELAKKLGISKSYLSMILSGKRKAPEKLVKAISSQKSSQEKAYFVSTSGVKGLSTKLALM